MKKIYLFILMLVLPISVFARAKTGCDYSVLSKLKKYASNVNIAYDYKIVDNEAYFTITINNLVPDIYVLDESTGKTYNYSSSNNGELVISDIHGVKNLKIKIMSSNPICNNKLLLTSYLTLPVYNKYSTDSLCDGLDNYKLCYTFLDTSLTYDEFKESVEAYRNRKPAEEEEPVVKEHVKTEWEKFLDFMIKYGIYIMAGLAIIITIISIRINKKNKFDFKFMKFSKHAICLFVWNFDKIGIKFRMSF